MRTVTLFGGSSRRPPNLAPGQKNAGYTYCYGCNKGRKFIPAYQCGYCGSEETEVSITGVLCCAKCSAPSGKTNWVKCPVCGQQHETEEYR
jgi:hypothetical protein